MNHVAQSLVPLATLSVCLCAIVPFAIVHGAEPALPRLQWRALPSLPDREGFAGMFAGVTGDALLLAGGANFPDQRP